MNTLSLAMIAKDEEDTLPRLMESILGTEEDRKRPPIFDEIILVDTGSTDRTKELAKQYGMKVYDFVWIDDFAAARNFAFSKVTCDWEMWLDLDDVILPEDRARLAALKNNLGNADAYLMNYNYAQDEFDRPLTQFQRHRILRTSKKIQWSLPIHEHLNTGGLREAMTNISITHRRTHKGSVADKGRNIRILDKAALQYPDNQRIKFYLGKELYNEGQFERSCQVLEEYLKKGDWHENQVNAWFWLAMSYLTMGKEQKAIDACMKGIELDPRWAEFYSVVGQIWYNHKDWGRAIRWFEIAASCPVPETWGTVLLDNYTWVPRDRLCVAASNLGMHRKAYEWNEGALGFRPRDDRLLFNRLWLEDQLFDRLSLRPIRLNLGSGGKPVSGWRNCDLYPGANIEFQMDQSLVPFRSSSVHALRSEHALEHSASHYSAESTLKEWARVLRPGGFLQLLVPDLDLCCKGLIDSQDRPREPGERWTPKEWYKYTIYGIQTSQGSEPADGQYHRTGFTKEQLRRLLKENGFIVTKLENYDGWGTPSIEANAIQVGKAVRTLWLLRSTDANDPSTRIRRTKVNEWLAQNGIHSRVLNGYAMNDEGALIEHVLEKGKDPTKRDDTKVRDFDVVIVSFFSDFERRIMDRLRQVGVMVVADYNEDLAESHPEVARCLESASLIVCCSKVLAEKASKYGRTAVIADAYEEA